MLNRQHLAKILTSLKKNMLTNFAFIDAFTQKVFIEQFGSQAIADCPEIRENLMLLSALVINKDLNYLGLRLAGENYSQQDLESSMDTEIDSAKTDFSKTDKQIILQSPSLELADYQEQLVSELQDREISTVFVYGVPMQACIDLCIALKQELTTVWLVQDATKSYKANERQQAKDLREHGIKLITVRNLEQYLEL